MLYKAPFTEVRDMLLSHAIPVQSQQVALENAFGRVLARPLLAAADVPPFDRSCFDGYAFRSQDVRDASPAHPVTLAIAQTVPAGTVPTISVTPGTAAKILTGAPIPEGADAVLAFEKTRFTDTTVTFSSSHFPGQNIVRRGEDVRAGTCLAEAGLVIDAFLSGTLAAQGKAHVSVYRRPVVGICSTGTEVVEPGQPLLPGKIYNSNSYMLAAAVEAIGCQAKILGSAADAVEDIAALLDRGLSTCDAIITTGGVSVGDFDLTPAAMEAMGASILARGLQMKPGAAAAFGLCRGKLLLGLSGNPASAMTTFYSVVQPVLKRIAGWKNYLPEEIPLTLLEDFPKSSHKVRFLRGQLVLSGGVAGFRPAGGQGNVILSTSVGSNVVAMIPGGSGPVPAGTKLAGFFF